MREKLRQALSTYRLLVLGAAVWIPYYATKLLWPTLISDASLLEKIAVVVAFACFVVLHYAIGLLDAVAILFGLVGLAFVNVGDALIRGRTWIREQVPALAEALTDNIGASPLAPEGDGTRNWPKALILGIILCLVLGTVVLHLATRPEQSASTGGESKQTSGPIDPGLTRSDFKRRFELCLDCGGVDIDEVKPPKGSRHFRTVR